MDEARESVIENTAGIQSLFIYLRIIILRYSYKQQGWRRPLRLSLEIELARSGDLSVS